ncbi:MAG: efflux RND transporter permease subunit, partial [Alphaproteobacteria bacterium]
MSGEGGPIGVFTRHPTAANLLMVLMILVGLFAVSRLNTQFFPDFAIEIIPVSVEWSGASAEDIDANIVQAIEPEVRFVDGVKRVRSTSVEGLGLLVIEFEPGTDMQAALANVETAVDQVTTLPEDSERPVVKRAVHYDNITRLVVSGPYSEVALKTFAKGIRDDLLRLGIDKIDLFGARDEEIWVEVDPATLRRLNLTLGDIAA